ncbi:TonB protein C-terminal [Flavobacterium swingsii]|jgi:protein TonB|uniref:TonB protein C-terminal n=1 Tax=Flavobacterium swingsii TaxID=498292 RepID=A0A1I0XVT2_9FLAO|nr:energy transducer TonB [Flavobacterium swingsii]SFB04556.1 TonB protein C-terminal [Flavobacterium swingsii]
MKKFLILFVFTVCTNILLSQTATRQKSEIPVQYEMVQTKPVFPGGINEFMKFVMKNYQAPATEEEEEVATGVLEVSIVIGVDGSISKVNIIKEVGNAGKEVKRVLAKCPKWTPGSQNGVTVAVVYNFPIKIQ